MKRLGFVVMALAFALAAPGVRADGLVGGLTPAQRDEVVAIIREAMKRDPSILRDAILALQTDESRRREGESRSAIASLGSSLIDPADPVAGNPNGDVTIVEFYDTRCPYCRRFQSTMAALLRADLNVRLVIKDMPILGASSTLESRALLAAQRQGKYFQLQEVVMRSGGQATKEGLRADAERLGMDGGKLLADMDDPVIQRRIDANLRVAQTLNVQGTPAIVIGQTMIPGAVDLAELQDAVAAARHR